MYKIRPKITKEFILNIESEEKLIKMLGYNLKGPDNSNRWIITDKDHENVGFIQYKKLHKKNSPKGLEAIYGYHTEINSKDIYFSKTRKETDTDFKYEFSIKREDECLDSIELNKLMLLFKVGCGFIQICFFFTHYVLDFHVISTHTTSSAYRVRIQMLIPFLVKSNFYSSSIR